MLKPAVGVGLVTLFFGPASFLLALGVLLNPSAQASCLPGTAVAVGADPGSPLREHQPTARLSRSSRSQLEHAATVITVGGRTHGVGPTGIKIALMAALTESSLRMLSNSAAYPESASLPNDGDGSDHDSLGMFQMRPSTGWGTVQQLMDPDYQARAFFGGPTGPNHGSPRGLLDIPGWQQMPTGSRCPGGRGLGLPGPLRETTSPSPRRSCETLTSAGGIGGGPIPVPESTRVVFPLPAGTWHRTDTLRAPHRPRHRRAGHAHRRRLRRSRGNAHPRGRRRPRRLRRARLLRLRPPDPHPAHHRRTDRRLGLRPHVRRRHPRPGEPDRHRRPAHRRCRRRRQGDRPASALRDPAGRSRGRGDRPRALARRPRSHQPPRGDPRPAKRNAAPRSPADAAPYDGANPNQMVDDPTSNGQITARTAYVLAAGSSPVSQHARGPAGAPATRARSTRTAAPATAPSATPSASRPPDTR